MKTLKTFFIICIAFCISSCSSVKLTETAPFKISGATYHSWVGGQPGVSGVNVIIGIDDDTSVTFKNIYFQTRKVSVTIETRNKKKYVLGNINTSTRSEETIIKKETKEKVSKNDFPFELGNNEAVLEYDKAGKTYYYKVSKIKKTETVFYP
jgi:hypothetical protein